MTDIDPLDRRLRDELLAVPDDFTARVMQRVARLPDPQPVAETRPWLTWLALAGGALLGAAQLAGFMFGIWSASTAG